jgi:hypothetical protein
MRQAQGQPPRQRPARSALPVVAEPPTSCGRPAGRPGWSYGGPRSATRRPRSPSCSWARSRRKAPRPARGRRPVPPLVRQRQGEQRDAGLARVAQSRLVAWPRFAKGRVDADDAIKAGRPLPWSTGPGAGPIPRRTLRKRQRCGRASLPLLQRRVVLAPSRGQGPVQRPQARSEAQALPAAAEPRARRRLRRTTLASRRRVERRGVGEQTLIERLGQPSGRLPRSGYGGRLQRHQKWPRARIN